MSGNFHQMALTDVQPGMVLSDELLDMQGQVLLPQGTVLTEAMLSLMPRHGISVLPIQQAEYTAEAIEATVHHHEARLERLFRKNDADIDTHWATAQLRRFISDYRHGAEEAPEHE
ncbi:hypothetical protein ACFFKC_02785 [Pseudoduganella danionis]|uniref:Uncharacterized protein n=1 Tax=Pseudoduganella danionis TaxID=1890295 RepID=A0ABW9SHM0_9BURK|nr:hypothetical protein [Pseudoduganella danionis]MTW31562.1 hypothetical protein [Pseudoduganella danionis]